MRKFVINIAVILFFCFTLATPVFAFVGGGGADYNGGGNIGIGYNNNNYGHDNWTRNQRYSTFRDSNDSRYKC